MVTLLENGSLAQEEITVHSYDCDKEQNMRPSAILRYLQEIAGAHCALLGMDYDHLAKNDGVFLIVRQSMNLYRIPKKDEVLLLSTWHRGTKGVQSYRETQITTRDGEVLVDSTGVWILAHVSDHRIWRPSDFTAFQIPHRPEPVLPTRPEKLRAPAEMEAIGFRPIRYTDIDYNRHVNNCVYADILCDFMPGGMEGKKLSTLDIAYIAEAKEGDTLRILAQECENGLWMRGEHERGKCFEIHCTF
ncbi:MAG: hypothetical protein IJC88_02690 [Oscillospiraceae bacterium]|nr:hypothetical protein [Oscillospiraceae bacterium]